MKRLFVIFFIIVSPFLMAQSSQLAAAYYDKGEFDKAVFLYESLYKSQPYDQQYFTRLVTCYQQLQQFDKAEVTLLHRLKQYKQSPILVALGYNYQLQNKSDLANKHYQDAINSLIDNPNLVYVIAREFENKSLINYAIQTYELASSINTDFNFDYPIALLYGQVGNFSKMIENILNYAESNATAVSNVQNLLAFYMNDDVEKNFSNQLRKTLLQRLQKNQDILWVQFLSWYFVQQQDFDKAFVHEKSIYIREGGNVHQLFSLAIAAYDEEQFETAQQILNFILENVLDQEDQLYATLLKNKILLATSKPKDYLFLKNTFDSQLHHFGITSNSVDLTLQIASFYGFELNNFNEAKHKIDKLLALSLPIVQEARVKEKLADLYLANQKFNQAIVVYGQIQNDVKNNELAHEAQFKMALTSYFKTDFDWAQKQFKVLKQSTSLLIANDALEMYLLINDATQQDSAKVVLTPLAKADFLKFQKKYDEAKKAYEQILKISEDSDIADVTLYRLANVNYSLGNYQQAFKQLDSLLNQFPDSIYRDDSYYLLGTWYDKDENIESAQQNFEQIIMYHQDSIYFLEAQTRYRKLRGDKNI
jgi:tetratricopeptide (TPR) repeat protein